MKLLRTFFGQVLRKQDVDYISNGYREGVTRLNIDLTSKFGGVINGLDVFKSIDGLSILVTPGTFYSTGDFNSTNNLGGGERAQVYTTQSFAGLPATSPIANQPSYLVVYVKIANQNSNPDPTQLQTTPTSKNIQTGENVLTRDYPVGTLAISNPVLFNQINSFNGVPLAVLQVDYIGTTQVSSNGTIQSIDNSIKRDYVIGGAVDVAKKQLIASAVPDNFITTRMIGSGQIVASQFLTGTVNSAAIAPYDGGLNVTYTGNGVATDHLKTGAVTQDKINYMSGLNDFSQRNYVDNASFEEDGSTPINWTFVGDTGTTAVVIQGASSAKFGNNSILLTGGASGSPAVSKNLSLSQNVEFNEPINGQNLTAYFYINPVNSFNGTDYISGELTFYGNITDAVASSNAISTQTFATYSGITTNDYLQIQTTSPVVLPTTSNKASVVNIAVKGQFNNSVYVDAVYLGLTSASPKFSVSLEEQIGADLNADNITAGTLEGQYIADGAISTSKVRAADGTLISDSGYGIRGDQIRTQAITASNIANNTITTAQLAAGVAAVPPGAMIPFFVRDATTISDPTKRGCPNGFQYMTQMEGRFPLGINPSSTQAGMINPGTVRGNSVLGDSSTAFIGTVTAVGDHVHGIPGADVGGGGTSRAYPGTTQGGGAHAHDEVVPYVTVLWCLKV